MFDHHHPRQLKNALQLLPWRVYELGGKIYI